jgi:putative sugar O-methyltransferase
MNLSNKNILESFNYCIKYYKPYHKADHWKKYNDRLKLYKSSNLKNFRNNSLSKGLDDEFSNAEIKNLFNNLNLKEKKFLLKNYKKNNIGKKKNFIKKSKIQIYGNETFAIKWYNILSKFLLSKKNNILEIGSGFGEFAEIIINNSKNKYVIIDLPEANVLSAYYLNQNLKKKKIFIISKNQKFYLSNKIFDKYDVMIIPPWCKIDNKIQFDIIINARSMMEMNKETIKEYFSLIQSHIKVGGIFLNINRYLKKSINNKIKICEFPYDNYWKIVKSNKAWMQNWVHMLITKRTQKKGNIKKELKILYFYSFKYELIQLIHDINMKLKNILRKMFNI